MKPDESAAGRFGPLSPPSMRIALEAEIAQAIATSWDEGYGDCPHGYNPCAHCDAHLAADAMLRRFRVGWRPTGV